MNRPSILLLFVLCLFLVFQYTEAQMKGAGSANPENETSVKVTNTTTGDEPQATTTGSSEVYSILGAITTVIVANMF